MTKKQTSQRVSSIAAKYMKMSNETMWMMLETSNEGDQFFADIRSMAASLLSQDEVPKP